MNSPPFEQVRGVDPDVLDATELDALTADIAACQSWLAALQVRATRAQPAERRATIAHPR